MSAPFRHLGPVLRAAKRHRVYRISLIQCPTAGALPAILRSAEPGSFRANAAASPQFTLLCSSAICNGIRRYSQDRGSTYREPTALSFDEDPSYNRRGDFDLFGPQRPSVQQAKGPRPKEKPQRSSLADAVRQTALRHPQNDSAKVPSKKLSPRPKLDHLGRRFHDYRGTIKRLNDAPQARDILIVLQDILSQPGTPHCSVIAAAFTAASKLPYSSSHNTRDKGVIWHKLMRILDQLLGMGVLELDSRGCANVLYACGKMKHKLQFKVVDALCAR